MTTRARRQALCTTTEILRPTRSGRIGSAQEQAAAARAGTGSPPQADSAEVVEAATHRPPPGQCLLRSPARWHRGMRRRRTARTRAPRAAIAPPRRRRCRRQAQRGGAGTRRAPRAHRARCVVRRAGASAAGARKRGSMPILQVQARQRGRPRSMQRGTRQPRQSRRRRVHPAPPASSHAVVRLAQATQWRQVRCPSRHPRLRSATPRPRGRARAPPRERPRPRPLHRQRRSAKGAPRARRP